jgi:phosphoglycolate phosphatase
MPKSTLLLFDIDGTLLTSGGAGEHALRQGFRHAFQIEENLEDIDIAGRTDSSIARQLFQKHGLEVSPENLQRFFDGYLRFLSSELPQRPGRLLPGIRSLLETLHPRAELALGLLTGNLLQGARLKLGYFGVDSFFELGAFADDHHDRDQLGPIARDRAEARHGVRFSPESIYVLGDTPHDIRCARAFGAKAIAVATGVFSSEQLAAHHPDVLLADFSDLPTALRSLGLERPSAL